VLGALVGVGLIDVVVVDTALDGVSFSLAGDTLELGADGVGRRLAVLVWVLVLAAVGAGVSFCLAGATGVVVLDGVPAFREVVVSSRSCWIVVTALVEVCLLGVDLP